jgi:small subunit ribosomal protein S20
MANTSSARKAARQITRRTGVNQARRTRMRSYVRDVEEAIAAGDAKKAQAALAVAEPKIMHAAQKGVMHKRAASRKVSRLVTRVRKLGS